MSEKHVKIHVTDSFKKLREILFIDLFITLFNDGKLK